MFPVLSACLGTDHAFPFPPRQVRSKGRLQGQAAWAAKAQGRDQATTIQSLMLI